MAVKFLFRKFDDDSLWKYDGSNLIKVGYLDSIDDPTFDSNAMTPPVDVNKSTLSSLGTQIGIVAKSDISTISGMTYKIKGLAEDQIVIQKSLFYLPTIASIESISINATGNVKVAISRDLENWYIWNGISWTNIGTLSNDLDSASKLSNDGASYTTYNSLDWSKIKLLYNGLTKPDAIAFAFSLSIGSITDSAKLNEVKITCKLLDWYKDVTNDVEIKQTLNEIKLVFSEDGDYRVYVRKYLPASE